ncbi:hypothetical protein INR18_28570, partial [Klebsiella pneumoniae]|nr:hypothetical protein [Klebsiella pneumoniae]
MHHVADAHRHQQALFQHRAALRFIALISEKLRHACGARVECVIADTCIAGMAESAACEEKFSSQNV